MTKLEIANVIRDFSLDVENMAVPDCEERSSIVRELRKFADRVEEDDAVPPAAPAVEPPLGTYHLHKHGEER